MQCSVEWQQWKTHKKIIIQSREMVNGEILRRSKRKVATLSQWIENARKSDQLCNPSGKNATVSTWAQYPVVDATLKKLNRRIFNASTTPGIVAIFSERSNAD
jgi:hypothetical protein